MSFIVNAHEMFWFDLAEARIYYETVAFNLGDKFHEAFEKTYAKMIENPQSYFNLSKKIRRIPISNFPYQIIDTLQNQTIFIWSLHTSSNKKTWKQRSKE